MGGLSASHFQLEPMNDPTLDFVLRGDSKPRSRTPFLPGVRIPGRTCARSRIGFGFDPDAFDLASTDSAWLRSHGARAPLRAVR